MDANDQYSPENQLRTLIRKYAVEVANFKCATNEDEVLKDQRAVSEAWEAIEYYIKTHWFDLK